MEQTLIGLFPDKLGAALLAEAEIPLTLPGPKLKKEQAKRLTEKIKHFSVPVTATRSFEQAQVTAGGVDTAEVFAETMESRLIPGLFFAGEVIDVDALTGGLNITIAACTAYAAGNA